MSYSGRTHDKSNATLSIASTPEERNRLRHIRYSDEWYRQVKHTSRKSAERKRIPFNLTSLEVKTAFERADFSCQYCGLTEDESEYLLSIRLTLDRDIPSKGYVIGNIIIACDHCNQFKENYITTQEMLIIGPILKRKLFHRQTIINKLNRLKKNPSLAVGIAQGAPTTNVSQRLREAV